MITILGTFLTSFGLFLMISTLAVNGNRGGYTWKSLARPMTYIGPTVGLVVAHFATSGLTGVTVGAILLAFMLQQVLVIYLVEKGML